MSAILMPDLSIELIAWERPDHDQALDDDALERVLGRRPAARRPVGRVPRRPREDDAGHRPWCPLPERLLLLAPLLGRGVHRGGIAVGERFLAGWDAFDRPRRAARAT